MSGCCGASGESPGVNHSGPPLQSPAVNRLQCEDLHNGESMIIHLSEAFSDMGNTRGKGTLLSVHISIYTMS